MTKTEEIRSAGGELLALCIPKDCASGFLTDPALQLQVGLHRKRAGELSELHRHVPSVRQLSETAEFLLVIDGELVVDVRDEDGKHCGLVMLHSGDALLLLAGSHKIAYHKTTVMWEVKQGPFQDDKEYL